MEDISRYFIPTPDEVQQASVFREAWLGPTEVVTVEEVIRKLPGYIGHYYDDLQVYKLNDDTTVTRGYMYLSSTLGIMSAVNFECVIQKMSYEPKYNNMTLWRIWLLWAS